MSVNTGSWNASRLGWLALASFPSFGSRTLSKLHKMFAGDGQAAYNIALAKLDCLDLHLKTKEQFLTYRQIINPTDLAMKLETESIRFVTIDDQEYPARLKQIADPPLCLFVRGAEIDGTRDMISIVGTRNCTPYGKTVAMDWSREIAFAGIGIVSGLAIGIDALAHRAALEAGAYCLAVLGSGIDDDTIYPRANLGLAHEILKHGGTLISEFPCGCQGFKHNFPLRNRIIAGLSRATLIVEATEDSGSLITAHLALQYNRDVYAVPGPVTSSQSKGTNSLIKQGAIPCLSPGDLLENYADHEAGSKTATVIELTAEEKNLLGHLSYPRQIDDLCRSLDREVTYVATVLLGLELKGVIRRQDGKIFEKLIP